MWYCNLLCAQHIFRRTAMKIKLVFLAAVHWWFKIQTHAHTPIFHAIAKCSLYDARFIWLAPLIKCLHIAHFGNVPISSVHHTVCVCFASYEMHFIALLPAFVYLCPHTYAFTVYYKAYRKQVVQNIKITLYKSLYRNIMKFPLAYSIDLLYIRHVSFSTFFLSLSPILVDFFSCTLT